VLREIVGTDACEVRFFEDLPGRQRGGRDFDHHANPGEAMPARSLRERLRYRMKDTGVIREHGRHDVRNRLPFTNTATAQSPAPTSSSRRNAS
jgi:hypothetical protein